MMNKLNTTHILLILSITFCIPTFGMNVLTKLNTKELTWKAKAIAYRPSVILTDCAMALGSSIAYGYFNLTKKDPTLIKEAIQNQRTIIKKNLQKNKRSIIRDIAKDFNIANEDFKRIMLRMKIYKNHATTSMNLSPWPTEYCSNEKIQQKIIPLLAKNNIKSINLNIPEVTQKDCVASSNSPFFKYFYSNIDLMDHCNPRPDDLAYITLNPRFFKESEKEQEATLIHEIGHLVENHSLESIYIRHEINRLTKLSHDDIKANENYMQLDIQHEQEAEIFPSIKCKNDASILRTSRQQYHYPKMLYSKHYFDLAFIDTLHKLENKFTVSE